MVFNPLLSSNPVTLESVKVQLDHWRQTRTKGNKMPKYLWDDLVTLTKQLDHRQIAAELKINPHRLREKAEKQSQQTSSLSTPDFVEIPLPLFPNLPSLEPQTLCPHTQGILEFTRPDGTTLKASGLAHDHLRSLVKDFLAH